MDWFDVLKVFVGFVVGYVFASLQARRYVTRIIGGIVRPQHPTSAPTITTPRPIGRIDRLPIKNPYDNIPFYNEACATCGIPRDLHLNPSDPDKTTPHTNWSDLNKCKNFKRCNPPRAAYGRLGA